MRTEIFPEYLGDISTEALLQNLTNENGYVSSADSIRLTYRKGFTITAEIERPVAEDHLDEGTLQAEIENRLERSRPEPFPDRKTLVRLVLEPK